MLNPYKPKRECKKGGFTLHSLAPEEYLHVAMQQGRQNWWGRLNRDRITELTWYHYISPGVTRVRLAASTG
jgi:hypothetical protein